MSQKRNLSTRLIQLPLLLLLRGSIYRLSPDPRTPGIDLRPVGHSTVATHAAIPDLDRLCSNGSALGCLANIRVPRYPSPLVARLGSFCVSVVGNRNFKNGAIPWSCGGVVFFMSLMARFIFNGVTGINSVF